MDMHGEGLGKREGSGEGEGSEVVEVTDLGEVIAKARADKAFMERIAKRAEADKEVLQRLAHSDHRHWHCFHSLPGFTIVGDGSSEIEEDLECCYCQLLGKKRHGRFWRGQP